LTERPNPKSSGTVRSVHTPEKVDKKRGAPQVVSEPRNKDRRRAKAVLTSP